MSHPAATKMNPIISSRGGYISYSDQGEPESSYCKCDSGYNKKNWTEIIGVMFIGLSFLATAAATVFSGCQTIISREAFIAGERAWVIPKGMVNPQAMDPPHPIKRG